MYSLQQENEIFPKQFFKIPRRNLSNSFEVYSRIRTLKESLYQTLINQPPISLSFLVFSI